MGGIKVVRPLEGVVHGTDSAYTQGCHCTSCKAAHTKAGQEKRAAAKRRGLPLGDPRHGTIAGRGYYGCDCSPCRRADYRKTSLHGNMKPWDGVKAASREHHPTHKEAS